MASPRTSLVLVGLCLSACASSSKSSLQRPPAAPLSTAPVEQNRTALDGQWYGALEAGRTKIGLDLVLHEHEGTLTGTLDVREQGLRGLAIEEGRRSGETLSFQVSSPTGQPLRFEGSILSGQVVGKFIQGAAKVPFRLVRGERPVVSQATEGEGYREEEVVFHNGDVKLAATLTLPTQGDLPPVAVLITGSGPQDRDENVFGFPVFKELAHALARGGLATLRVDDRGVGQSSGEFYSATTADFATDAEAAMRLLETRTDVDVRRIGLIGHSEGGLIAPLIAARNAKTAFIVLLAAPAQPLDALLLEQVARVGTTEGQRPEAVQREVAVTAKATALLKKGEDLSSIEDELLASCTSNCEPKAEWLKQERWKMENAWFRYFITIDPRPTLRKVRCPVLALGGSHDVQVPSDINLPLLRKFLPRGRRSQVLVEEIPSMNHVLQRAQTGAVSEYAKLPKALVPEVPEKILKWIHNLKPASATLPQGKAQ